MNATEISQYLKMKETPAGAVLNHIISKSNLAKKDVAEGIGITPQRMNDLIHGKRRVTVEMSLLLESILNIQKAGFFYQIQTNYDIFRQQRKLAESKKPNLEAFSKTTFWDVDIRKIDWDKNKMFVIYRVLEYGTADELKEIESFYGKNQITKLAKSHRFRLDAVVKDKLNQL